MDKMDRLIILRNAFNLIIDSEEDSEEDCSSEGSGNFAEDIVPRFSDQTFKEHFRISPDIFEILCNDIHTFSNQKSGPGREAVLIEKQLMIMLWYLGNQESMSSIAERFGVCIATVWRIIAWNCDAFLQANKTKRYIKWPTTEEASETSLHYYTNYRLSGIVGLIDVMQIPIRSPTKLHSLYINPKTKGHSVLLQGICNHKMQFTHCYTGEPGSISDALLLSRSSLADKIDIGEFHVNKNDHLLGDSALPLQQFLITPYNNTDGHLLEEQHLFNKVHSKCMSTIYKAFGLLKGRFRRLTYIDSLKPASIVKYIIVACILHNICLKNKDVEEEFITLEDNDNTAYDEEFDEFSNVQSAQNKREQLLNGLYKIN